MAESPTTRMSDAEALMWHAEKDPMLSSNVGSISILDAPVDFDVFRNKVAHAVVAIPRLRQRVRPTAGRLAPPVWETDPDFDLDHHVRRMGVGGEGGDRDLFDLVTRLVQDPMDRTRPLWQFFVIDGFSGGRSALFSKLHHTVTDGEGGVRLALRYMDPDREPVDPGPVDLAAVISEDPVEPEPFATHTAELLGHQVRRNLGRLRRLAGELAVTAADPQRVPETVGGIYHGARQAADQLGPRPGGSPLWTERSRGRHLEVFSIPFRPAIDAARALGGKLNDLYMTAAVEGASRYHVEMGAPAEHLVVTFVVSTRRSGDDETSNHFSPAKVVAPAGEMDLLERFGEIRDRLDVQKSEVRGDGLLSGVAGVANLLPTSVITRVGRQQAEGIDLATSNVKAAPFPVFVAGAEVLATYPVGPLAGTPANLTVLSYNGRLDVGLVTDPAAVERPDRLAQLIHGALEDLIAAAGISTED